MADLRRLQCHWRKIRYCDQPHPHVVHLCFISYDGLTHHHLYDPCLLDEYEKICKGCQEKPLVQFIIRLLPKNIRIH
jgi:hypothetical protein